MVRTRERAHPRGTPQPPHPDPHADPRWAAVCARDRSADPTFVYAVTTTGVYCRPSCPSRRARPENVRFYDSAAHAERAGFRACKRCRPDAAPSDERTLARVAALCRLIEESETAPSLEQLAAHVGLSPFHTHRAFKAATGVTPRAYAAAHRAWRLRAELAAGSAVTAALYQAGYGSSGRLYAESSRVLGMTPSQYRAGGPDQTIHHALARCSLGVLLVAATELGVCAISLGDDPEALRDELIHRFPRARLVTGDEAFERLVARVVARIEEPGEGLRDSAELPLDIRGTAFQRRVWQALTEIPPGATRSYTELARAVGAPRAVRAVASACAANTLAVVIPCHRVVRSDGSLSGYRWGVPRKRALLEREASAHPPATAVEEAAPAVTARQSARGAGRSQSRGGTAPRSRR